MTADVNPSAQGADRPCGDRKALAEQLNELLRPHVYDFMQLQEWERLVIADAILASDWLRERGARVGIQSLRHAAQGLVLAADLQESLLPRGPEALSSARATVEAALRQAAGAPDDQ